MVAEDTVHVQSHWLLWESPIETPQGFPKWCSLRQGAADGTHFPDALSDAISLKSPNLLGHCGGDLQAHDSHVQSDDSIFARFFQQPGAEPRYEWSEWVSK